MSQLNQTGWQIFVEVPGKAPIELPNGESVIGRSRASLVQVAETTVSRQHAIFVVAPGKVILRDLGSSNGTFVNGQRVDGEIPLTDGDRVVVGEAELVLRMLAPLGPSEATAKMSIPPLTAPEPISPPPAPVIPSVPPSPSEPPLLTLPASPPIPSLSSMPPLAAEPSFTVPADRAPTPAPFSIPTPRISPSSGAQEPWAPTPLSRNPAAPAPALSTAPMPPMPPIPPLSPLSPASTPPAPSASPAIAKSPAPAATAVAGASPAPATGPKGDELLPSISDIDLAPVPPPVLRQSSVVAGASVIAAISRVKVEPAGFWLRVLATVLDAIPFFLLSAAYFAVAFFVSPNLANLVNLVQLVYGLLVILVLPAVKGVTPGKKLMKLAIVSESTVPGQGLGWKTAALRLVGYLVCSITFGLGYLLVAFSARKQGLHDLIAKTNVVRKRPAAA